MVRIKTLNAAQLADMTAVAVESKSINPQGGGINFIHSFKTPAVFTFSPSLRVF